MDAGADDFPAKPFEPEQLQVRLRVAERIVTLEREVASLVERLKASGTPP
jgi:DNA-binding response OmpR family regulator